MIKFSYQFFKKCFTKKIEQNDNKCKPSKLPPKLTEM